MTSGSHLRDERTKRNGNTIMIESKPLSMRTDQMVYACYDQERGIPCDPLPTRVVRENRTRTPLPDVSLQEVEAEAMERWLDDGGTSDNEATYDVGVEGFSPLQFLKP
jgi:hypothetical protein